MCCIVLKLTTSLPSPLSTPMIGSSREEVSPGFRDIFGVVSPCVLYVFYLKKSFLLTSVNTE